MLGNFFLKPSRKTIEEMKQYLSYSPATYADSLDFGEELSPALQEALARKMALENLRKRYSYLKKYGLGFLIGILAIISFISSAFFVSQYFLSKGTNEDLAVLDIESGLVEEEENVNVDDSNVAPGGENQDQGIILGAEDSQLSREDDSDGDGLPDWWEDRYGLDKDNADDANQDLDGDGLTNYLEYSYNVDPLKKDTDEDGYNDGNELAYGYDPRASGNIKISMVDSDMDGISDEEEINLYGTDPKNHDTDGDIRRDGYELDRGMDPTGNGELKVTLHIPKIGVEAPVVWTDKTDPEDIAEELNKGVVHLPNTAVPGREAAFDGYITGHSSNSFWSDGKYDYVFKKLHKLEVGDEYYFEINFTNGKKANLKYIISEKEILKPEEVDIYSKTNDKTMRLVSCYPPMTNWKRVIFKSEFKR